MYHNRRIHWSHLCSLIIYKLLKSQHYCRYLKVIFSKEISHYVHYSRFTILCSNLNNVNLPFIALTFSARDRFEPMKSSLRVFLFTSHIIRMKLNEHRFHYYNDALWHRNSTRGEGWHTYVVVVVHRVHTRLVLTLSGIFENMKIELKLLHSSRPSL